MEVSFGPWRRGGSMADEASQVLLGSGLTVLSQPLMYVKVLVQVRGCRGGGARLWHSAAVRGTWGNGTESGPEGAVGTVRALTPQVGYEPLPPTLGRNIFGRQVYQLPGLFAYGEFHSAAPSGCSGHTVGL